MAIFSGKIVSVKFFDKQKTIIEVLYKENDQTISYALEVDWESNDFHDLLEEYSLEDIERRTLKGYKEKTKQTQEKIVEKEVAVKVYDPFSFDFYTFLNQRFDPGFIFHIKADIFRLRGIMDIPESKIKKIKKSNDALELMYLLKLALK